MAVTSLDVSAAAFAEIKKRLELCGHHERITKEGLEMEGLMLRSETDQRIKVWILFEGKKIEPRPVPRTLQDQPDPSKKG